jgi:4-amino-4-deoxy-L-arabinose transferase-like glycosyltransferase
VQDDDHFRDHQGCHETDYTAGKARNEPDDLSACDGLDGPVTLLRTSPARGEENGRHPTTPRRFLALLSLGVVLVRATYVPRPLRNDEGGYLFIARHWHTGGEFLYGDYFVDRPPLLLLIFKVASLTEWDQAIRVLAIPFVVLFVLAGWRAGILLGGRSGGRWAALVAAGVMCSPGLAADQADGELFGAAFVMVSIALALSAWHAGSPSRRLWLAIAAGAFAAAAPLIKQNLLEGGLFLAGLVVLGARAQGERDRRRAAPMAAGAALGAVLPCTAVWLWLTYARIEPAGAWRDLVGFRSAAFDAIWSSSTDASIRRAALLLVLGVVTGLVPLVCAWFLRARRCLPHGSAERRTITTLLVFGLAAVAAGGSYWPPYLLQLAPASVLAAGALAPMASRAGSWMRMFSRMVVSAALVGTIAAVVVHATVPSVWFSQRIGEWLVDAQAPADTAFVAYGLPSVLETADMPSPYPYLWSVPMRTSDPEQARLRATLAGSGAPSWIVQVTGLNAWHIDDESRLRGLLHDRYRVVAKVCGHPVWLRQDLTRELPAPPPC